MKGLNPRGSLGLQAWGRTLGLPPSRSRAAAAEEVADAGEGLIAL